MDRNRGLERKEFFGYETFPYSKKPCPGRRLVDVDARPYLTSQRKIWMVPARNYLLWRKPLVCNKSLAGFQPAPQRIDFLPIRHTCIGVVSISLMNGTQDFPRPRSIWEWEDQAPDRRFLLQVHRPQCGLRQNYEIQPVYRN